MQTKIYMIHDLNNIPPYNLPQDYQIHFLQENDDMQQWANILKSAQEFVSQANALIQFHNEFQPYLYETKHRMLFLKDTNGTYAGTATAWSGLFQQQTIGRLHWVAIHPNHQGKGLAKPLIVKAMDLLAHYHQKAYLNTQPRNLTAIRLYLQLGFQPVIHNTEEEETWQSVYNRLPDI